MNLVIVSGPPSSGKTAVILKTCAALHSQGLSAGVVKFDCLHTDDDRLYEAAGIPVKKGLSGALCPDHFFVSNIEECRFFFTFTVFAVCARRRLCRLF